jgi:hypothetical protein
MPVFAGYREHDSDRMPPVLSYACDNSKTIEWRAAYTGVRCHASTMMVVYPCIAMLLHEVPHTQGNLF